jgi:hypothetical protein
MRRALGHPAIIGRRTGPRTEGVLNVFHRVAGDLATRHPLEEGLNTYGDRPKPPPLVEVDRIELSQFGNLLFNTMAFSGL